MQINLDDCKIEHDGLQYILSVPRVAEKGRNKGKTVYSVKGYYPKESQLVHGLIRHGLSDDSVATVTDIKGVVEEAIKRVENK